MKRLLCWFGRHDPFYGAKGRLLARCKRCRTLLT